MIDNVSKSPEQLQSQIEALKQLKGVLPDGQLNTLLFEKLEQLTRYQADPGGQGSLAQSELDPQGQQAVLQKSEQLYRDQFINNLVVMLLIDPLDGAILEANAAALSFYGYPRERLLAMRITDINTLPAAEVRQAMTSVPAEQGQRFEFQHRLADGSVREVEVSSSLIKFGQRQVLHSIIYDITERKQAEAALRESQQAYRQLVEQIPEVIYTNEIGRRWQYLGPNIQTLSGYTAEELRVDSGLWLSLVHAADRDRLLAEIGSLAVGDGLNIEYRIRRRDGELIWVRDHGVVKVDGSTGRKLIQGLIAEITAQKELEAALHEREANFRTFFETMTDLIFVATPEGRIFFTNQAVERKLGYSTAELTTMHVLEVHPADKRREAEEIFAAMFRGEREVCPLPLARHDGSLLPVETRVWVGQWNGAACIFGLSKDLSAEQEAQQRFERLFRHNPALMALSVLPERRITDVNDAYLKATGYARADLIGKTSAELGLFPHPEQQAVVAGKLQVEGRIVDFELQLRCKDGTILDGLFSGEIISSQGQEYLLTVMIDITERKQVGAARAKLEAQNRQMEKAESLGRMAGAIAEERLRISREIHDGVAQNLVSLRQKVGLMHDWAEQDRPRLHTELEVWQEQLRQNIQEVQRAIFALRPLASEELGFYPALRQYVIDFGGQNQLQIDLDLAGAGDKLPALLEPVLFRLIQEGLNNVAKHARASTVWVKLNVQAAQSVDLTIRDDGLGFDPASLPQSPRYGQVGLTQMQERVAKLDGVIVINSEPGQGTTLQINLPLSE